jgi:hypothetical protein
LSNLPEGASGFTTIELKSNHLNTAKEGTITCIAKPVHLGKTTQVWDAVVTQKQTGKNVRFIDIVSTFLLLSFLKIKPQRPPRMGSYYCSSEVA